MKKISLLTFLMSSLMATASFADDGFSPQQSKKAFQSELKKFDKLVHHQTVECKPITARSNVNAKFNPNSYGNFTLTVNGTALDFTGNPGDKESITELNVGEFTVIHFGGSTGSTRYLAVVDYAGNLGSGETDGNLIQMDEGQVTRSIPIHCTLKP